MQKRKKTFKIISLFIFYLSITACSLVSENSLRIYWTSLILLELSFELILLKLVLIRQMIFVQGHSKIIWIQKNLLYGRKRFIVKIQKLGSKFLCNSGIMFLCLCKLKVYFLNVVDFFCVCLLYVWISIYLSSLLFV